MVNDDNHDDDKDYDIDDEDNDNDDDDYDKKATFVTLPPPPHLDDDEYDNDGDDDNKKVTFVRLPSAPHLVALGWWSETHWLVVTVLLLPYLAMMIIDHRLAII